MNQQALQGPVGELSSQAVTIRDLDLSGNLIGSWREAERLCQELASLHTLNLSQNRLCGITASQTQLFPSLRRLVLNSCDVEFSQVVPCAGGGGGSLVQCIIPGLRSLFSTPARWSSPDVVP